MGLSTDWSKKELDECYRCWLGGLDSQAQALSVWSLKVEDPRIMVSSCMQVQAAKLLESTSHYNMQLPECRRNNFPC